MTLSDNAIVASIVANIASTFLAAAAFILSFRTFKRQQTFDNENQYHEYKFNTYVAILKTMMKYFTSVEGIVFDTYDKLKHKEINNEDVLDSADKIDDMSDALQNDLASIVAFIPIEIIEKINEVIDLIYDNTIGEETNDIQYENTQRVLTAIANKMAEVEKLMINDLGIDNIHKRLARRTRESKPSLT